MHWDRFDICEAYCCLAHDWGLYALYTRLESMGFKPRPGLNTGNLEENAKEIYDYWDQEFSNNSTRLDPYDPRPMVTFLN